MRKIQTVTSLGVILALLAILAGPSLQVANAAALTSVKDTLSRLKISTAANHTINFTTVSAVGAAATIKIQFDPTGDAFDLGTLAQADLTVSGFTLVTTCGAGTDEVTVTVDATAPDENITFTVCTGDSIAAGAKTVTTANNKITNPATAGTYIVRIGAPQGTDTGDASVQIVADDQVAVSATVGQTLSFSISAASLALGTLSVSAVTSGSHTISLATNAPSGMAVTFSGSTLTSGANTITAMSTAAASSVGTEQFGINAVANTTPTVGAACSGTAPIAAAATGYSTANSFKFVSGETIVSSAGAINTTTCTVSYITNIAGTTEAGSYTTALTFVATATF